MASQQQTRRDNVSDERKIEVEKDKVPKMTTHFESLATKDEHDATPAHVERVHVQAIPVKVMGVEYSGKASGVGKQETGHGFGNERKHHGSEERQKPSLEDISNVRQQAQQNSMEAIRAAEERYEKAKGMQSGKGTQAKEVISSKSQPGAMKDTAMEKGQQAKGYTQQKAVEGKDVISSKGGAMTDTAIEKAQQAREYAAQKAMEAKDVISSRGGAVKDTTVQAKDYTAQKAMEAKDVISSKGQTAAEYAADKARAAKDTVADTSVSAAGYVQEKAVAAKDVTMESGKGAAGYAGKVAEGVKYQAVVAGWGTAHYTLEKVAEATKAVAGVTSSVAGYTGEKAVVAKDKLAGGGQTVVGYAGEKIAKAKDAVVSTEEKAAEYAARKQEEAKRDLELQKSSQEMEGGQKTIPREQDETKEYTKQHLEAPIRKVEGSLQGGTETEGGKGWTEEQMHAESGGGVLQAIGETLVEIGQTTQDLLVGQSPVHGESKHEHMKEP